ncbi:MAG: 2-oxoisovalerate dehydrogenase [Verrucomicrobiota bacterium]
MKKELIFQVEQEDGTFVAVCHEPEMATQGDTLEELVAMIKDLVRCRFEVCAEELQWPIRLHFVSDPILVEAQT